MELININKYKFLHFDNGRAHINFSTAEGNLNFNKETPEGIANLNNIKKWFDLDKVGYLNQIHSDRIFVFDGKIHTGDALITNEVNTAIGIFTADCLPVILYDSHENTIAAVHSGWRGTYSFILQKTIKNMKKDFDALGKNIHIYIGPHIRMCCYHVDKNLIDKFKEKYGDININDGNMLNLERCIIYQALLEGVPKENIHSVGICTHCYNRYKMHSFRKDKDKSGRMFSFVYIK